MKRIHSYSGGIGSRTAAVRDAKMNGTDGMILLFTDTLIEDKDLYRWQRRNYCKAAYNQVIAL